MWYLWIGGIVGLIAAVIAGAKTGDGAAVFVAAFGGLILWPLLLLAGLVLLANSNKP
ncbi:hypothetical protein [Nocardioides ultimimeridianus]